jgi:flagellar motor switch protein FliN/FliY
MAKAVENIELETLVQRESTGAALCPRDINLFGHVNVEVTAEVGHAEISIEKLLGFKAGDVLQLKEKIETPLTLYINNKPVALGHLVAVDDNFGVQITEIL